MDINPVTSKKELDGLIATNEFMKRYLYCQTNGLCFLCGKPERLSNDSYCSECIAKID